MIDVDEVHNRVYVGVRDETTIRTTLTQALQLGLPSDAIAVETIGEPAVASLQAYTGSLMGGYQIDAFSGTPNQSGECTLGFNAVFDGAPVFITNSHCSWSKFTPPDGQPFYQPLFGQGAAIGYEVADMGPKFCAPFSYPYCRDSDAVYASHDPGAGRVIAQGNIARSYRPPWAGVAGVPTTVYTPSHRIVQVYSTVTTGMVLDKTGRTTGQTWGTVSQSCIHVNPPGGPPPSGYQWWLRCQDVTYLGVNLGDSGSPVYQRLGGSNHDVALAGIVWGFYTGTAHTLSSRISGIQADLGPLNSMCIPGYPC